ncbi:hypothetical protein HanPI659440_Chr00c05g0713171 [Helianthus annuus]|nr:hypothetical protein HanPI659440_Chr00c05g0713171 [Helianthus annuus]
MFRRSPHNSLLLIVLSTNTLHSHKNGDQSSIKSTHPQLINPSFSVILSVTRADPRRHSAASSGKERERERERSEHGERERRRDCRFLANRICGGLSATHLTAARLTAVSHSTGGSSSDGD